MDCMQVFSADMFETKFKGNVLSKSAGREYRDKVIVAYLSRFSSGMLLQLIFNFRCDFMR